MRVPDSLAPLVDYGIVEEVIRPLMSGKEAQVFVVVAGGKQCVAKVYKEAQNRSFKHRSEYTEGRKVRNTRDQRAMEKRSSYGRAQDEAAWRSTEVDVIHRLYAAGVRVPVPHHFVDGVLIMELIQGVDGHPAPRLADVHFTPEEALSLHGRLIREVTKMLCAGVVHGDLSDFNVLIGADGPVIIDFPQSVDTAQNANARKLLLRDVANVHSFLARFMPGVGRMAHAEEMWDLFQQNLLTPDTKLSGRYHAPQRQANTREVLDLIRDADFDERKRRQALGLRGGPPAQPPSRGAPRPQQPPQVYRSPHAPPSQQRPKPAPQVYRSPHAPPSQQRAPQPQQGQRSPQPQQGQRSQPQQQGQRSQQQGQRPQQQQGQPQPRAQQAPHPPQQNDSRPRQPPSPHDERDVNGGPPRARWRR